MSSPGLVVVPHNRAVKTSVLGYATGAAGSPVCLSIAMFAGCLGLGASGVFGALIAVAAVFVVGASTARYAFVRKHLDEQDHARARLRRECQRMRLLRGTGTMRVQHYHELRMLVDEIERRDPAEAARFELEDLLDHFIRLAISHQRCSDALRVAGTKPLPSTTAVIDNNKSRRRRDIIQRRLKHRDQCVRTMEQLVDELEGIDELIRLVAQRTAAPQLDVELDREIDRRLWELDEVDAAMHQLSA